MGFGIKSEWKINRSGSMNTTVSTLGPAWSPVPFVPSSSIAFSFFINMHWPLQCSSGLSRFSHSSSAMRCLLALYHANTPRQPRHWYTSETRSTMEAVFFKLLTLIQQFFDISYDLRDGVRKCTVVHSPDTSFFIHQGESPAMVETARGVRVFLRE